MIILVNILTISKRYLTGSENAGLKLRADKCVFMQKLVKYLGHIELQVDPAKVEKVASWPTPKSAQEVQQFLGFANYYRK